MASVRVGQHGAGRTAVVLVVLAAVAALGGGGLASPPLTSRHALRWTGCGTTRAARRADVQCASVVRPMDYGSPRGASVRIALARVPATDPTHRIGSLFIDFGGPGAGSVDDLRAGGAGSQFARLNRRFDVVGFDPRGVGESAPAVDCRVDQEQLGLYSEPVPTPATVDVAAYTAKARRYVTACLRRGGPVLRHLSTANVARDLDGLRAAVGDDRLTYLGYSYGTFLGATYAALFPTRYRALVLDGPVDAQRYVHDPMGDIAAQTAGFEDALARFEAACARDQEACHGFGGTAARGPAAAVDALIARAQRSPLPATRYSPDARPVTADDVREAMTAVLYSKRDWPLLADALVEGAAGDGSLLRAVVDEDAFQRRPDGSYDPGSDLYFTIGASEQLYPRDPSAFFARGALSHARYPHFWANSGYAELSYALWPDRDADAFDGPFTVPASSPAPLVVATTHDPATPYAGARRLVGELGNARLLTMDGDGHTAYGGNSACVDAAVDRYLVAGALPARGTRCRQRVAF